MSQNLNVNEGISPWRAAKPRRPLADMTSPSTTGAEWAQSVQRQLKEAINNIELVRDFSPPNSSNKESTRLESGCKSPTGTGLRAGMELSQGASPALARGEDTVDHIKSKKASRASTSYTKIKSGKSKSRSKMDELSSENEESEEEQPAARCQYVGTSRQGSPSINTANNSKEISSRLENLNKDTSTRETSRRDASRKETSRKETDTNTTEVPKAAEDGWGPLPWILVFLGVAGSIAYNQINLSPNPIHDTEPLSAEHWKKMRTEVRDEIKLIKNQFPNQTGSGFWPVISASVKAPMQVLPDYPGVLLLISTPPVKSTAHCLAARLTSLSSKVLARPGLTPPPLSTLTIHCEHLNAEPNTAKEQLTASLNIALSTGSAAAVLDLELLHPVAALTLHAFTDNSNAPYKQAVVVAVMEIKEGSQHFEDCKLEQKVERALANIWGAELGADKLGALLSRLVVNVVEVQEESYSGGNCSQ